MKRRAFWAFFLPAALLAAAHIPRVDADDVSDRFQAAAALDARGDFGQSVTAWREAEHDAEQAKDVRAELRAYLGLARALHALGQLRLAQEALEAANPVAKQHQEKVFEAEIESSLGSVYMAEGLGDDSEKLLQHALQLARELGDARGQASALNNLGIADMMARRMEDAAEHFQEALRFAKTSGDVALELKVRANLVRRAFAAYDWDACLGQVDELVARASAAADSHEKAEALLEAGKTCVDMIGPSGLSDDTLRKKAFACFAAAEACARREDDHRSLAFALGYQGGLYAEEGKLDDALALSRHAAVLAQEVKSDDSLFRWRWQIARILKKQNQREEAISAYQSAIAVLQNVKHDMALHFGNGIYRSSFREAAGSIYFELADLLLQRSAHEGSEAAVQADLAAARDTAEDLKEAELEDYFQDECANLLKSKITKIDTLSNTAAVIYFIPLADRTEILVNLPGGKIKRVTSKMTADQLETSATLLRYNLEKRTTDEYLEEAKHLYDELIAPLLPVLQQSKIDTLVFVPDGALRTIPMAALYDGQHFLVEKYAIATTPGLTLTEPKPLAQRTISVVANGLSVAVQGNPALDFVPDEMKEVKSIFGGVELLNDQFVKKNVEQEFINANFTIVHIASHGHFDSDAKKTWILTYDGKLNLDDLERLIRPSQLKDQPVELLTLSACQTAAGDDRAALGLAGIAVKAGARSALATLWYVNDRTSSMLLGDFYKNLRAGSTISKAKALQQAQIKLLSNPRYDHPCYWAPYQIIGNWL